MLLIVLVTTLLEPWSSCGSGGRVGRLPIRVFVDLSPAVAASSGHQSCPWCIDQSVLGKGKAPCVHINTSTSIISWNENQCFFLFACRKDVWSEDNLSSLWMRQNNKHRTNKNTSQLKLMVISTWAVIIFQNWLSSMGNDFCTLCILDSESFHTPSGSRKERQRRRNAFRLSSSLSEHVLLGFVSVRYIKLCLGRTSFLHLLVLEQSSRETSICCYEIQTVIRVCKENMVLEHGPLLAAIAFKKSDLKSLSWLPCCRVPIVTVGIWGGKENNPEPRYTCSLCVLCGACVWVCECFVLSETSAVCPFQQARRLPRSFFMFSSKHASGHQAWDYDIAQADMVSSVSDSRSDGERAGWPGEVVFADKERQRVDVPCCSGDRAGCH